jgi:hypothetical protein
MKNKDTFVRWFRQATGHEPYPFQIRFADGDWLRNAVPVPGRSEAPRLCKAGLGEVEGGVRASWWMCRGGWKKPQWHHH